ncbi:uncharacterized protein BDR25DRAFT_342046 [Lindgomyces ingoldianus]|uniref:Uncharacterized protein n=1 Tax=Lindgomyces ingoldianus TaxID=673940 RepID=A0ACB6QYE3_9PLEO|nr:uncharacterized protein BDR25DRAFT_342046 [Lindgomyces ingoldianus]KAF2472004.1 hypothetical protein BDR25DRAFT_342046 [Lindgomyces ingoldianus]
MPSGSPESPGEGFFNDLSQQVPDSNNSCESPSRSNSLDGGQKDDAANKPKRIACVLCRRRKLRCDGTRPTCGTCKRLAHDCAYDEVRKKSGPKRGYVKLLEARLQQVETLLKNQESNDQPKETSRQDSTSAYVANTLSQGPPDASGGYLGTSGEASVNFPESISPGPDAFQTNSSNMNSVEGDFQWEMIGLGLDEPLPPQDVINDLYQLYFTKIHPSLPIIHRPRFLAAMNLAPHMRPPVCLRYIMWTLAASVTDKYDVLQEHFYHRARKYAQMDEMKGHGESTITLGHCQSWILMATYEFKQMYFPRAWLSAGRAVRLAQMMQLHRLDGAGLDVKQCLPPPKDWTEREERRRTFWMAFCVDRYASIGTGWPMTIDERDIMTNMPSSEEAFEKSKPMPTGSLQQAMGPQGAASLQPFGGIVLTAALFGRNLLHLHRPGSDDRDDDLNGGFWTRHRSIENILLNTSLGLPDHLRLPCGLPDPNVVFLNMSIHTSAICLHQASIFKADKYRLPVNVSNESKIRCVTAAAEIASVMRMISHLDLAAMNPFISFCVYVAARVFVQYLKTRPKDQQMNSSLQFLLQAMQALRRKNPLTESFLVQLDLDLESAGVLGLQQKPLLHSQRSRVPGSIPVNTDSVSCSPIFEIRESQSANAPMNQFTGASATVQNNGASAPYNDNSPGPPFHDSNIPLNMKPQPTPFVPSQGGPQMDLPSRDRPSNPDRFAPNGIALSSNGFNVDDGIEMDTSPDANADQPSPSTTTSQSRGGSTSHTSYSPGQQDDNQNIPYRASPSGLKNQIPLPHSTGANNSAFFPASEDMFSASLFSHTVNPLSNDPISNGFMVGNEWGMPAGMGTGTGMTPISEGGWNQMLESINLGWDSMGPPHGNPPTG